MSNLLAKYGISPEREKAMWRKQNIEDLLYWADLPFEQKLRLVEGMVDLARSMHGGKLPRSADEHQEPWGTLAP
jgi:hypothetical protein